MGWRRWWIWPPSRRAAFAREGGDGCGGHCEHRWFWRRGRWGLPPCTTPTLHGCQPRVPRVAARGDEAGSDGLCDTHLRVPPLLGAQVPSVCGWLPRRRQWRRQWRRRQWRRHSVRDIPVDVPMGCTSPACRRPDVVGGDGGGWRRALDAGSVWLGARHAGRGVWGIPAMDGGPGVPTPAPPHPSIRPDAAENSWSNTIPTTTERPVGAPSVRRDDRRPHDDAV